MGSVTDGTPAAAGASRAGVIPTDRQGHGDQGFVLEAPATTRVLNHGIGLCEAVQSLTEGLASAV